MANPLTVKDLAGAKVFPTHRSMIAAISALMDAGKIETYSIHANSQGVSAGVRCAGQWAYLA